MNFSTTARYVMLAASASAMFFGIAVVAGWFVPTGLPGDYGTVMGAVIFLYGAYRFAVTFYGHRGEDHRGSL